MESDNLLRRRIISNLTDRHIDEVADALITLWEQIASQIILIIGEGGFNSLYARSLFLSRPMFPWLPPGSAQTPSDNRFVELKQSFERQPPLQANKANCVLLITFTDILASLIGEQLTLRILYSAWGDDQLGKINRELTNE
jgi:hypothetical protein